MPAFAADTLAVGAGMRGRGWQNIASWGEVDQVTVKFDSVYNWDVSPGANVAKGIMTRGHAVVTFDENDSTTTSLRLPDLAALVDGDPSTAFDPDDWRDAGMPRSVHIHLDLGAAFRVNRIRLYPRLDQDHKLLFPQIFRVSTFSGVEEKVTASGNPADAWVFLPVPGLSFSGRLPNRQPVVDVRFPARDVRHVRLEVTGLRPWELAELELYGDGSVPMGVFRSIPLGARHTYPIWGRVRYEGGDIDDLPITLQTRTGPDFHPIQYFRRSGVGDDLELVNAGTYGLLEEALRGGTRANPAWSDWETVTDGRVRSPSLMRYIQFRILFPEPGTKIRRLVFEYTRPPVVQELSAEIDPRLVSPGVAQDFTLSLLAYMRTSRNITQSNTGFRLLQVFTPATVHEIRQVLVDDASMPFTARITPGRGFTIRLRKRILQDGTFIQVHFRGSVFRDGTPFDARVADARYSEGVRDTVSQSARAADVDPTSPGGDLLVRFDSGGISTSLVHHARAASPVFTPNGDGVNDVWRLSYDLLKLTAEARVELLILDLSGRPLRHLYSGADRAGHFTRTWDGTDARGALVPPGVYLYRLAIHADHQQAVRHGSLGVIY